MQRQSLLYPRVSFNFQKIPYGLLCSGVLCAFSSLLPYRKYGRFWLVREKFPAIMETTKVNNLKMGTAFQGIGSMPNKDQGELTDEDDDLCPVECVREFKTDKEFFKILEKARETDSLVVVDFYRTSCGSCKYIEQVFSKLCKGSGDQEASVIFLKHNVIDEYDEQSEVAERLRIKAVPLFHFYKDGVLLEAFPTRDKERITATILKYTTPASEDIKID
ncbi:PREDICTED: thioredoxin-like 4, chloroplastic [Nelumbo nucifera]|uniref:Thioredoxin-like 4, chloroplastic n=2 Tax=Nelumbo nucifera TaxID=4432 RepID=A0A1U8Q7I7_NELNU|nr:PREDICTED: thioredoxin-like 4, chloroplastic [Nelumbo nucifera]XP_019054050.1 PREDICTED: thioredoxin-like 4, chloroplastic [Nelumbo nucifera]XP_019054051.1 PREDICTED: thioredoxin-like 4, chloroplastic [Nelumbo nucifera]DAD21555.1 TPA_asm: hypothetical protein HUJ06_023018 [Nelumbo nucifera]